MESGFLPIESFLKALSSMQRQPKMDSLQGIFCWLALSFIVCVFTKCKRCGFSLSTYSLHFSSAQHNSDQHDLLVFTQTCLSFCVSKSHCNVVMTFSCNENFEADLSILELYILVCMHRLEDKEQSSYNFTSIMKGRDCSPPSHSPLVIRDRKVN